MPVEPFYGGARVINDTIPFCNVDAEMDMWGADKAYPHKDTPEYHAHA